MPEPAGNHSSAAVLHQFVGWLLDYQQPTHKIRVTGLATCADPTTKFNDMAIKASSRSPPVKGLVPGLDVAPLGR